MAQSNVETWLRTIGTIVLPANAGNAVGNMLRVDARTTQVEKLMGWSGPTANTFAHAMASAVLSADLSVSTATSLGNARELAFGGDNLKSIYADLYNNAVGRGIYEYAARNGLSTTRDGLESLVIEAVNSGQTIVHSGGKLYLNGVEVHVPPGFTGNPETFNDEQAVWKRKPEFAPDEIPHCFTAGVMISMADGSEKPIEQIMPGDMVMAFDEKANDGRGELKPSRVARTFVNQSDSVIDFHGTKVTAGHAYLCGDGPHRGSFRPIIDIIRDDGAVVDKDGRLIRAATNCAVGSRGDAFVKIDLMREVESALTGLPEVVTIERGCIRAGTRLINPDGTCYSLLDLIDGAKWRLQDDGLVVHAPGQKARPLGYAGSKMPKPEDYILARGTANALRHRSDVSAQAS